MKLYKYCPVRAALYGMPPDAEFSALDFPGVEVFDASERLQKLYELGEIDRHVLRNTGLGGRRVRYYKIIALKLQKPKPDVVAPARVRPPRKSPRIAAIDHAKAAAGTWGGLIA